MRRATRRRWRSISMTARTRRKSRGRRPPSAAPAGWSCRGRASCPTASASSRCAPTRRSVVAEPAAYEAARSPSTGRRRARAIARGSSLGSCAMRVGVIGGGLMGSGIAEVCARSGVDVTVVEADDSRAERARAAIDRSLSRGVRSGKLSEDDKAAAMERLAVTATLEDIEGVDAAIEAVVEDERLKRDVFRRLDELLPDARFLASNTSSVPIMKLGAETKHPGRVLGMH